MITIKCPKCTTLLKVAASATAVRVKCPKCQTLLQVPASTTASPQPQPPAGKPTPQKAATEKPALKKPLAQKPNAPAQPNAAPVQPSAPAATPPAMPTDAAAGAFDFGSLGDGVFGEADFGVGGSPAPAAGFDPLAAPAPGFDPLATSATIPTATPGGGLATPAAPTFGAAQPYAAAQAGPATQPSKANPTKTKKPANKKTLLLIALGGGGILALLICGGLVAWLVSSAGVSVAGSSSAAAGSPSAAGAAPAPEGFKSFSTGSVSAALPRGEKLRDLPTGFEGIAVKSETTNNFFMVGSGTLRWPDPKTGDLSNFVSSQIMATVSLGDATTRGERSGLKGRSYGGLIIPSAMEVEVYPRGSQFDIVAWGRRIAPRPVYDPRFPDKEPEPPPPPKATDEVVDAEIQSFLDSIRL